jgi:hypothetical protein
MRPIGFKTKKHIVYSRFFESVKGRFMVVEITDRKVKGGHSFSPYIEERRQRREHQAKYENVCRIKRDFIIPTAYIVGG